MHIPSDQVWIPPREQFSPLNSSIKGLPEVHQIIDPSFSIVLFPEGELDHARVTHLVDQVTIRLKNVGLRPGDAVAVEAVDPFTALVAFLAVWACGGVTVPISSNAPEHRRLAMFETAAVRFELALRGPRTSQESYHVAPSETRRSPKTQVGDAYVLFTSGSSGEPKGVVVRHEALTRRLFDVGERFPNLAGERLAALSNPVFDISLAEILLPAIFGGCLLVPPSPRADRPEAVAAWLDLAGATIVQATPTMFHLLRLSNWVPDREQTIWSAGESLTSGLASWLASHAKELWNLYGPTESIIYATAWKYDSGYEGDVAPIGSLLPNTVGVLLENEAGSGELCIGGPALARTYLTRAGSARLPSTVIDGVSLYRTGDICSEENSGLLRFRGRHDRQIKLRGFRVELEEVEARLLACSGVVHAVVFAEAAGGVADGRLVAVLAGSTIDPRGVREELRQWLPDYMVPSRIVTRSDFPRTPSGKLDRRKIVSEASSGMR